MGRMGESHESVEAVLYLVSANFVTGETLYVDGGQNPGRYNRRNIYYFPFHKEADH
jgi:NAD(P)-dependent dehydrogenase (short-subunit alcohol dehydrogenase family)